MMVVTICALMLLLSVFLVAIPVLLAIEAEYDDPTVCTMSDSPINKFAGLNQQIKKALQAPDVYKTPTIPPQKFIDMNTDTPPQGEMLCLHVKDAGYKAIWAENRGHGDHSGSSITPNPTKSCIGWWSGEWFYVRLCEPGTKPVRISKDDIAGWAEVGKPEPGYVAPPDDGRTCMVTTTDGVTTKAMWLPKHGIWQRTEGEGNFENKEVVGWSAL